MGNWRIPVLILTALVVVILIGGTALWVKTNDTATANSQLICAFGQAIGAQPVKQNHAETDQEFRTRIAATRTFLAAISGQLKDCDVPTKLRIDPSSEGALKGVDARQTGQSPSRQPSPPSGGHGGNTAPPQTPPAAPSPPEHTFVVPDPIKTVCGVTGPLSPPTC